MCWSIFRVGLVCVEPPVYVGPNSMLTPLHVDWPSCRFPLLPGSQSELAHNLHWLLPLGIGPSPFMLVFNLCWLLPLSIGPSHMMLAQLIQLNNLFCLAQ